MVLEKNGWVALDVRYARNDGVAIAYHVVGDAEVDLVFVPDFLSNLVYDWEIPYLREFYARLARSFRLILFDKRGCGLSDIGSQFAALETRMEDMRVVLDAVGSQAPVVLSGFEGTGMAALYAATYPERVRALVLFHPPAPTPPRLGADEIAALDDLRERWGTQSFCDELLREISPTLYRNDENRVLFANQLRLGASPAVAYAINRSRVETDLRDVFPAIRAPTLVLHNANAPLDEDVAGDARDVAARIPGARSAQVSGDDWWGIFLAPDLVDEVERFVAGREVPEVPDSVLATVMFTDIVASSERAAEIGDRAWRDLLTRHNALIRRELARFRGEERDTAGDGFFATFDGPARAIRCGHLIVDGTASLGLDVRVGIHVGECELHEEKVMGVAVNIGARVAALARPGEVLVTRTVKDLTAGTGLGFQDRGVHALKGIPGSWHLHTAERGG
jgi:class 3 adenylate cyclase/pimeloyl-ACP methyl ester carboxylesterase